MTVFKVFFAPVFALIFGMFFLSVLGLSSGISGVVLGAVGLILGAIIEYKFLNPVAES